MLKNFCANGRTTTRSTPRRTVLPALAVCFVLCLAAFGSASAEAAEQEPSTQLNPQAGAAAIDPSAGGAPVAAADVSPEQAIETFHEGLLGIMKDAKQIGFQGRIDRLAPLLEQTFDLDFMASKTVGGHWRKLSEADKERWTQVFARITVCNYAGRFTGFTGEEFVTTSVEQAKRGQQLVLTKIVLPEDEDVQLNYRLRRTDAGWKVIDVYLNGTVSELALRRSEYSTALKREGFEELVASIETKIQDLKAKGLVDG